MVSSGSGQDVFTRIFSQCCCSSRLHSWAFSFLKKHYGLFLWKGPKSIKNVEQVQGGSLISTTNSQEFLVSHLIILRRIKAWVELGAFQNPTPGTPGLVIQQILQMPFLLCINDLPEDIICNITIYADDTTLCTKCDQASDLWWQLQLASELESETLWTGAQGSLLMSLLEKLNLLQLPV